MKTKFFATMAFLMAFAFAVNAQEPGFEDDVDDVPLDGGISLLVGAGALYGIKKYKNYKDQLSQEEKN